MQDIKTPPPSDWRERFEKECASAGCEGYTDNLLSFIETELTKARADERAKLKEMIEGMKWNDPHTEEWHNKYDWQSCESKSINEALDDILKKLEQ